MKEQTYTCDFIGCDHTQNGDRMDEVDLNTNPNVRDIDSYHVCWVHINTLRQLFGEVPNK